jgi:carbohydrate-selective porin OprB
MRAFVMLLCVAFQAAAPPAQELDPTDSLPANVDTLRALGLQADGELTAEWLGSTARYLAALRASADLRESIGWRGASAFAEVRGNGGTMESDGFADSGLIAEADERISELWLENRFAADRVRGRLGLLDANREFAAIDAAGSFFSAATTSPAIAELPSWPETKPGVELFAQPVGELSLGAGLYRGDGGWFAISEMGLSWDPPPGRLAFGWWRGSGEPERQGAYLLVEQQLAREAPPDDGQGLRAFVLHARSDAAADDVRAHSLFGLTWRGALPRRDDDEVGLLCSLTESPAGLDGTLCEAYYRARTGASSSVQLGVQLAREDGAAQRREDALAIGVHVEVGF